MKFLATAVSIGLVSSIALATAGMASAKPAAKRAASAASGGAASGGQAGSRFCFIQETAVLRSSNAWQKARQRLNGFKNEVMADKDVAAEQAWIEGQAAKAQANTLSEAEKTTLSQRYEAQKLRLQPRIESIDYTGQQQEGRIRQAMGQAVSESVQEFHCAVVLDSAAIVAGPSDGDISRQVLDKLNARLPDPGAFPLVSPPPQVANPSGAPAAAPARPSAIWPRC